MKVTIKKATGILVIPDNFAELVEITDEYFVYEITYKINPVTAIKQSSYSVAIKASTTPAVKKEIQMFSANPSETQKINDNILLYDLRRKDIVAEIAKETIGKKISDITNKIPNNLTTKLSNASITNSIPIRTYKDIENVSVSDLRKSGQSLPVFDLNINKSKQTVIGKTLPSIPDSKMNSGLQQANEKTQKLYSTLLYEKGIDPTQILGSKSNSIIPTKNALDGTVTKIPFFNKQINKDNYDAKELIETFLNTNNSLEQQNLVSTQTLPIIITKTDTLIEKKELIKIPKNSFSTDQFYIIFELLNLRGTNVQTESKVVFHNNILEYFQMPTEPPIVSKRPVGSPGKITFDIKQMDSNSSSINVYAKKINPGITPSEQRFTLLKKIQIRIEDGLQKFEDIVATTNPIIYRFIPVGNNNKISSVFTNVFVSFTKNEIPIKTKKKRKPYYLKINANVISNKIQINVSEIPINAVTLEIYKRDVSYKKKFVLLVQNNLNSIGLSYSYLDPDIKDNRIYEYIAKIIYKDGTVEQTSTPALVEYLPVENNILSFTAENFISNNNDTTFEINFSNIKNSDEIINNLLIQQNLNDQFGTDVIDNKSKLNKLFAFQVKRINLTKGIEESFGILQDLNFSDSKLGKIKNVEPINAGNSYQYEITAFVRSPETLFPTLEKNVQVRPNVSYSFKPYKWHHPITLNKGNIKSESSLIRNYSKNTFSFGNVVAKNYFNVDLTKQNPTIVKINAIKSNNNKILLQWQIDSNPNAIDHFIIRLNALGVYTIIGKSHSITDSTNFQFLDILTNGEKGSLTYYITPIYLNNSSGITSISNSILV